MAQFRWDAEVRYMGAFVRASKLPWHYTLTWISITTPLLYLALFRVGVSVTCRQILACGMKLRQDDGPAPRYCFFWGVFCGPISAVLLFHSVLYDGWRQLYFVYPAFLLLATKGWMVLWSTEATPLDYLNQDAKPLHVH